MGVVTVAAANVVSLDGHLGKSYGPAVRVSDLLTHHRGPILGNAILLPDELSERYGDDYHLV